MECEKQMAELIKKTARMFYEPGAIVILDLLLSKLILFDYEICEKLKMLPKEFHKIIIKLKEDRLVCCESKIENENGRSMTKTAYYLDYAKFKDTIKYKIFKMSKKIDEGGSKNRNITYWCQICKKEFSLFEMQSLIDEYFKFKCDECCGAVAEKIQALNDNDLKLHKKVMEEVSDILELLKKLDKHNLQCLDYFQVLKLRKEREENMVKNKEEKKEAEIEVKKESVFIDDEIVDASELKNDMEFTDGIDIVKLDGTKSSDGKTSGMGASALDIQSAIASSSIFNESLDTEKSAFSEALSCDLNTNGESSKIDDFDSIFGLSEVTKQETQVSEEVFVAPEILPQCNKENVKNEENTKNEKPKIIRDLVKVAGIEKPFNEITSEDQDKMSPEEYEYYFEVYSKYES
ncbi:hypothetical protein EDEG_03961 [Edhazardia aedis USNM 41457]|uniref:HTH TFE/IIEalpha-type domain-containing protein n=1 Tax=Edhazardia aedis (strain USNM 41457) TaxID=1003232 RepID=J8ZNZ4_EDHAE|nr:hypothetical protein EDEG_03961 [Edhazardia aedis USNM 41457]|eukprot:EJW01418.1 hypothetical protein EDEG_03961 [Edhazardia aedis USNM 41457]